MATDVFVMMPLDLIHTDGTLNSDYNLDVIFSNISKANATGVMLDVWWGIVEPSSNQYKFDAYVSVVQLLANYSLQIQFVLSFHQCGGNPHDACNIPLPSWVKEHHQEGKHEIFYRDVWGNFDEEYLTLGVDHLAIDGERTPLEMYQDMTQALTAAIPSDLLGTVVVEYQVGLGPCGELRYPSYQSNHWVFPGIGSFQCYDKQMVNDFHSYALDSNVPFFGMPTAADLQSYNATPDEAPFFADNAFSTPEHLFFINWYSQRLIQHGSDVLGVIEQVAPQGVRLTAKLSGVFWLSGHSSHAAEVTAGYPAFDGGPGYLSLAELFMKRDTSLDFTCIEMQDVDQPDTAFAKPFELVRRVSLAAEVFNVSYSGENANEVFTTDAFETATQQSKYCGMESITWLRWGEDMAVSEHWDNFVAFVKNLNS